MGIFKAIEHPISNPPYVPSKAAFVMHFGIPSLVYHHGTIIEEWISNAGEACALEELLAESTGAVEDHGVYLWSGGVRTSRSYEGEVDAWLKGTIRPCTQDEWQSIVNGEIPFDFDEIENYRSWIVEDEQNQPKRLPIGVVPEHFLHPRDR
jgi:hypothetical protein